MKRKLLIVITILLCFCALMLLTSCGAILDLIFGPNPSDTDDNNEHVHTMTQQTYTGETCAEQEGTISYFKCSGCGKCYLDRAGTQLIDESSLGSGHKYVYHTTDDEHFLECDLCHTEQQDSRQTHSSTTWFYTVTEHYQKCDVCDKEFNRDSHDPNVHCTDCGRKAYAVMCNSNYGYDRLKEEFKDSYVNMQKLYNKIDQEVSSAHDNANRDFPIAEIASGSFDTALSINCSAYNLTSDEACAVLATYRHDHPLYYWLHSRVGILRNTFTEYVTTLNICINSDYAKGAARIAKNAEIYTAIDKYLSYVANETDPYEITLTLHDKIITDINYAYKSSGEPQDAAWAHSIEGVFTKKSAVCEGYAKAFQLLLNACGVNNIYVNGYVNNNPEEGHAWNLVQLSDKQWYWYDLTWDDQPSSLSGKIHTYFCKHNGDFDSHTPSTKTGGLDYLYDLPAAATTAYKGRVLPGFPSIFGK